MKRRIKARTGLVISACFALQLIPASLSITAAADSAHATLFALPRNRLAYSDSISENPMIRAQARLNVDPLNYATFINHRIRELLPEEYKIMSERISQALIEEANRHKMDPLFLMAMIEHESQFRPDALGSHGEIGLMQIKPSTASWLAQHHAGHPTKLLNLADVARLLRNPIFNIRCGTAYLASLAKSFHNRHELYLAAYNQGPANLRARLNSGVDADRAAARKSVYSLAVMSNYRMLALEFLSENEPLAPSPLLAEAERTAMLLARASLNDFTKPAPLSVAVVN